MPTKHYYFVSGLDPQGDKFAGSCVAGDIINAINLFRNICHSVHEIKMGVQAPADHEECITVLNGVEYTTIIAKGGVDKNLLQIAGDLFHVKMVPCNRCIFRREIPDRDEDGRPIARVECDKQDGSMWVQLWEVPDSALREYWRWMTMSDFFQYSPMARAKDGQVLFTYDSLDTLEEAVKQFDIWKDHYHYDIIEAWVDVSNHGKKVKTIQYAQKWVAEEETEVKPQEPYPEFIGRRLRDIILEKLPSAATDICHGGVAGCPSDYSYFNRTYDCTPDHAAYDNCSHESCTACWNQVYVGKDKEGNW